MLPKHGPCTPSVSKNTLGRPKCELSAPSVSKNTLCPPKCGKNTLGRPVTHPKCEENGSELVFATFKWKRPVLSPTSGGNSSCKYHSSHSNLFIQNEAFKRKASTRSIKGGVSLLT